MLRRSAHIQHLSKPAATRFAAAAVPVAFSLETIVGDQSHLASNTVIITILASTIFLLLGVLFRLRQLRIQLEKKTVALVKSERHLRLMGDNLPSVTIFQLACRLDGEFIFNYLSKGYERALGFERDRVLADARIAFDHVYESDIPSLKAAFEAAEETLEPADLEIRVLDVSGNLKWLHISAVAHREGDMLVWDGFMQDISVNKVVEDALLEENRNFQNLFETIDDFLLVCDMNGNLIHTNPSVEKRLNYSREELTSMSIFELYPEAARAETYQVIARMQSERSTVFGLPLQTREGHTIPVEMNVFQGTWKNRKVIFGVARDIASRQRTEDALRESQQMLQVIMDNIPMSVFWKDKDSVYLGGNKTFIQECGLENVEEIIGKNPMDLFNPSLANGVIDRDQQVISTNQPLFNAKYSHTRPDGTIGWRNASIIPLHDENRDAVGVLGVWRDITEQNRGEDRLKRTLEDMERFNQLMRGRERRTLELKEEINTLLVELGNPKKYRTTTETLS